jgi:hypothetical protein
MEDFFGMMSVWHIDQYSFQTHPSRKEVDSGIDIAGKFVDRMETLLDETVAAER